MLELSSRANILECGVDEAGRGALCGPVVAAAVVWNPEYDEEWDDFIEDIKDSKLLTTNKRKYLSEKIKEYALDWSISFVDNHVIDEKNILQATYDAMHHCIGQLVIPVENILVDGNRFREYPGITHSCVVKGDNKYVSIAAASILAKVARDEYMLDLASKEEFKEYQWEKNLGYGTKAHMTTIAKKGPTPYHRLSFRLTPSS